MKIIVVMVANLLPLVGAIWFDWKVLDYLAMYWLENWVVLAIMLAKARTLVARGVLWGDSRGFPPVVDLISFCAAYLLFTVAHGFGVFLWLPAMVFHDRSLWGPLSVGDLLVNRIVATFANEPGLLIGFLALAASHLYVFWRDFVLQRKFGYLTVHAEMKTTMQRVTTLHVAVVVGGAAAVFLELGTLLPVLAILVILKTLMEVGLTTWAVGTR
jgi:hypothetical protein